MQHDSPLQLSPLLVTPRFLRLVPVVLLLAGAGLLRAANDPVAVFATTFNGYTRARLPDHSYKPEAYVVGEGGCLTRPVKDAGMEEMTFPKVADSVTATLARMHYVPARVGADAQLLILVFWGSTQGSRDHDASGTMDRLSQALSTSNAAKDADAAVARATGSKETPATDAAQGQLDSMLWQMGLANEQRDQLDSRNAQILGYSEDLSRARSAAHMSFAQDILSELSANRYYVVLQAYDYATAVKTKRLKPLWTVRMSMAESGKDFSVALDPMLRNAAQYFGQDSKGLRRYAAPEGRVDLGPTEYLGTVPGK